VAQVNRQGWVQYLDSVHELAHAWDAANGWRLSEELEEFTGGRTVRIRTGWYRWREVYVYGGVPPKGADDNFNRREDFAESVTTFVYPGEAQLFIQRYFRDMPEFHYDNYYRTPRALYVARLLGIDPSDLRFWQKAW